MPLRAVGSYIFAGGFTLGVKRHFEVLAHLEDGQFGVATAKRNFPGLEVHTNPKTWPAEKLKDAGVHLVYANPPCAPWSTAGIDCTTATRGDWRDDPRTECVARAFSLLERMRPVVWTFESVRQVYSKGKEMLDSMRDRAAELGYSTDHVFVEAKNHGVPQHRKRYFMVCRKCQLDWHAPMPPRVPTVDEALRRAEFDDQPDEGKEMPETIAALAKHMAPGENAKKAWFRETAKKGSAIKTKKPAFLYDRLAGDRPSFTILGTPNKLHPREDRIITVNESKAICGYPPSFWLEGKCADKYAQVGRGVTPPVAAWLALNLVVGISRGRRQQEIIERIVRVNSHDVEIEVVK